MKRSLLLSLVVMLSIFSCDDDSPYQDYLVARPVIMDAIAFKAEAIDIEGPTSIVSSGKIYAYKDYIFVNDVDRGFHVINNQNPSAPQSIAFIKLEGNYDISIKDDKLFADSYGDLVIFDISNITDIKLANRIVNAIYNNDIWLASTEFPQADIYDYSEIDYDRDIVIGWQVNTERRPVSEYEAQFNNFRDDMLANSDSGGGESQPSVGQGGSMARFKIVGDFLYVVDYSNINIFDISDVAAPKVLDDVHVAWDIETIFNQGAVLFIGGRQGLYIYDIKNPAKPEFISEFRHGTACDPVVVDGSYAYVTLKGGNFCGNTESGLYIVDISNLKNPELKVIYPMIGPNGLGIKGDNLFVCDGSDGLKVFDKSKAPNLVRLNHFENIEAYDVIPLEKSLLMIGGETLRQYEYLDDTIRLLSTFNLN
jgi:hypothetical protein